MQRRLMLAAGASTMLMGIAVRAGAQATPTLADIAASVVKIACGNLNATGFLWPDASSVVTALHVIDGSGPIVVHAVNEHGQITKTFNASVRRVLKDHDLALLALESPFPSTPLRVGMKPPAINEQLDALGFAMNIPATSSTRLNVRFGGKRLKDILPTSALQKLGDYPSQLSEILNLEGNLVPGMSGAPIVNHRGEVVGIADGGIEDGTVGRCWGIPTDALTALKDSTSQTRPHGGHGSALFSAEANADVRSVPEIAGVTLTRLRRRTFAQLSSTADDILGLTQLSTLFGHFQPQTFSYDVYQDLSSGASIAVPEGAVLRAAGHGLIAVHAGNERMHMLLRIVDAPGLVAANQQVLRFEQDVSGFGSPGVFCSVDPSWSYLAPMQKGNVSVNRKAYVRSHPSPMGMVPEKYFFETLAHNGRVFLGVCAINNDNSPQSNMAEAVCGQRATADGQCEVYDADFRVWAQLVLGAQFSTFPPSG